MRKILVYTSAAVLLGIVTMLAPFELFMGKIGEEAGWLSESAETMKGRKPTDTSLGMQAGQVAYPLDTAFVAFMLIFSLVVALSIMFYFKRRMFGSPLP